MKRFIIAAVLAFALIVPATTMAIDPSPQGSAQQAALDNPTVAYLPHDGNPCGIEFTPNSARAWWILWFASPVNLEGVRPTLLPGSLVLTPEQYASAVALSARGNTLPSVPRSWNPLNLPVNDLIGGVCPFDPIVAEAHSTAVAAVTRTAVAPATIGKLRGYIANLSAVRRPTAAQTAKLALYKARLVEYLARK